MSPAMLRVRSTLGALLAVFALTLLCYRAHTGATIAAVALLLAVLLAGAYTKPTEAVIASFAATVCLDYFFIPPIGSISISDPHSWIVLIVFLAVALVATSLASRLRRERDQLISRQQEAEKIYALSRAMLFSEGLDVRRLIVNKCIELFGLSEVALFEKSTGRFYRAQAVGGPLRAFNDDPQAVGGPLRAFNDDAQAVGGPLRAFNDGSPAETPISEEALRRVGLYGWVDQNASSGTTIVPVVLGNKTFGSLGFRGAALPETTLQTLGNTIATGLAQAEVQEAGSRAEAIRRSEELKSLMIDALAHDLKTPLTAIEAAAGTLLDRPGVPREQGLELLDVIREEAQGLRRMVNEAIHLARIDAKRLKLERQPTCVQDLVQRAIESLGERSVSHDIAVELPEDLPLVFADRELIVQALKQLLDNAVKYSAPHSKVIVSAAESNRMVSISVRDHGPGLTELEQGRVFDKFYRGRYDRSAVQGTGMGLAITKEILEAHGGSATVESQLGQGARFTVALYAVGPSVEVGNEPT